MSFLFEVTRPTSWAGNKKTTTKQQERQSHNTRTGNGGPV